MALYGDGEHPVSDSDVERARRKLEGLVKHGQAVRLETPEGRPAVYARRAPHGVTDGVTVPFSREEVTRS
jgi:hypothetical protein